MTKNQQKISEAISTILVAIGENPKRPGLKDTPTRVARSWEELSRGYKDFSDNITLFPSDYSGILLRSSIPFSSLCEHHLLPFSGTIDFAYVPNGMVIGISKIIRLFRHLSARLCMQEDLTSQLLKEFSKKVKPKGSAIRIKALHSCESCRGITQNDVETITILFSGSFAKDASLKDQFLKSIK